jgi:hypothetical protein
VLPLVCDPGTAHRRRVWEAWAGQGRTGRWGPLLRLGVVLRAFPADKLGEFDPYRQPAPLQTRDEPTGMRGISREVVYDPEDPDYQPPPRIKPPPMLAR